MRKLPALLSLALATASIAAVSTPAEAKAPKSVKHGYVVNRIVTPMTGAQANKVGFDLDGDGDVDNRVGQLFAVLASQGVDLQATSDAAVRSGDLVTLLSIQSVSLNDAAVAKVRLFKGESVDSPDLDGGGTFTVDSAAPATALAGRIVTRAVTTKPAKVRLVLPSLYPGLPTIRFDLRKGRLAARCTDVRCSKGRIGGGIPAAQIDSRIIPAIGAIARAAIAADCTGTTESTCADDSNGKTMMQLFDSDDDGTVTDQEVRSNPYVRSALAPDVDLDHDGTADALSIGIGFRAVNATVHGD